ncbi:HdeD family acid-resistance protein [Bacillus testis]|uniref:HdeD family acid-resistance protein n=1 Tax=Bacillus testis TaxID=1622072 RepID=UPI00067EC546|nr:DUF308 domain-containing protein [Bacillus testis]
MNAFSRFLVLLSGLAMICLGFWFVLNPPVSLVAITVFIGLLMIVSGIFHIILFFYHRNQRKTSGWLMADGLLTLLLGVVLVFDRVTGTLTLIYFFSFWVLFSGLLRLIAGFEAREFGFRSWGWIMGSGVIGMILGFIALFNPILTAIGMVIMIGSLFVVQGIYALVTFYYLTKFFKI